MASAMQPTAPNILHALATHLVVHQEVQWQILLGLGMAPYPHNDHFRCTSFEHYQIPSAADPPRARHGPVPPNRPYLQAK